MTIPDRNALRQYLAEHAANPEFVAPAMQVLEPLFRAAESDKYPLVQPEELDREEAAKAISAIAGKPVKVALFSWGKPFPKPEWMSERAFVEREGDREFGNDELWWGDLETSCAASLEALMVANLPAAPEEIGVPMNDAFAEHLFDALEANLRGCLEIDVEHRHNEDPRELLHASLWHTLFHFGSAVLMGDAATMERMAPLMRLLPQAIPLAKKADAPGTWIVLTA